MSGANTQKGTTITKRKLSSLFTIPGKENIAIVLILQFRVFFRSIRFVALNSGLQIVLYKSSAK